MLSLNQKINYLFDSAIRYWEKPKCPYCSSTKFKIIDRKYFVTKLMECHNCHLYYRHPVEKVENNQVFYQESYLESDNITASLPSQTEIEELKSKGFQLGNKNANRYLDIFHALFPQDYKISLIDYGCSWGYISYQLKLAGIDVESYEISKPRAVYGNKNLDLNIKMVETDLRSDNDIFFSSHVIEHHPDIKSMIEFAFSKLKTGGLFIAISPNGSKSLKDKSPEAFHSAWGKVHPNYLNDVFYKTIFKNNPFYIGCSPFNTTEIATTILSNKQIVGDLSSIELIVVVKKI